MQSITVRVVTRFRGSEGIDVTFKTIIIIEKIKRKNIQNGFSPMINHVFWAQKKSQKELSRLMVCLLHSAHSKIFMRVMQKTLYINCKKNASIIY